MIKPKIIGILNLTQDSFSDGGKYIDITNAIDYVKKMINAGVDIIDIGAESTKPGFKSISPDQQLEKILPVLNEIKNNCKPVSISIDTRSSLVAKEALNAGAVIINDVSSGTYDSKMMQTISKFNATIIFTHMPESHQSNKPNLRLSKTLEDIQNYFHERIKDAIACGVKKENIIIDPGICYGKTGKENIEISSRLFKNFNDSELNIVSLAVTAHCVINNVSHLRVHDVIANKDALEVAWKTHTI